MVKTQVQDGFFLKRTDHTDQTIDYLISLTGALKRLYEVTLFAAEYVRHVYPCDLSLLLMLSLSAYGMPF